MDALKKLFPFSFNLADVKKLIISIVIYLLIGVVAGYIVALIFTVIGYAAGIDALKVIDFTPFTNLVADGVTLKTFIAVPEFSFLTAIKGAKDFDASYLATIAVAYIPVAFVVFAEHLADHKNLSTIIGSDLLKDPGLHRTLLGDGLATMLASLFGAPANTTYGENTGVFS